MWDKSLAIADNRKEGNRIRVAIKETTQMNKKVIKKVYLTMRRLPKQKRVNDSITNNPGDIILIYKI